MLTTFYNIFLLDKNDISKKDKFAYLFINVNFVIYFKKVYFSLQLFKLFFLFN